MKFDRMPLSQAYLEHLRLDARRKLRRHLVGGHVTRRMGQSLEFHEYVPYAPGDDTRRIDWRASFRVTTRHETTPWDNLVVRRMAAEEHLKLLISLDTRETMTWPREQRDSLIRQPNISKLQAARWLAEALAFIALRGQNQVTFHRLFGDPLKMQRIKGTRVQSQILAELNRITDKSVSKERFNEDLLDSHLPPAAAWIIITDFYYDPTNQDETRRLLHRIRAARNGMRWVILVDMDSWNYEQRMLERGARRIQGPYITEEKKVNVNDNLLAAVKNSIQTTKQKFIELADYTPWVWPDTPDLHTHFASFFQQQFSQDRQLQRLFMRDL